ncbi:MAG TPA: 4Fe-4S ferredoxin [Ruminococcus sp.]|nr:4Fe-4S ferredoxin [Ruminococcus sp.]
MSGMHRHRMSPKKQKHFRLIVQMLSAAFCNGFFAGFMKKTIFTGSSKRLCVPVLNCYSCPGALGSCPIGALQTVLGTNRRIPFYTLGTMMLFGVIFGRLICGFFCPFGLIQDLLHKIPLPKYTVPKKTDRILRYVKYAVFLLFVILLPLLAADALGNGSPYFCKWLCPAGTLEGGIPHVIMNPNIRALAGKLFTWKSAILLFIVLGSVRISRFFCRYFCPLGAFYALFQRLSCAQMTFQKEQCISCEKCDAVCPMALDVRNQLQCGECIQCGKCQAICPANAISRTFLQRKSSAHPDEKLSKSDSDR